MENTSIPAKYYKINTAIWKDQQENCRQKMSYVQQNLYIYIYMFGYKHFIAITSF